ncbi:P-loop containing nucleoside triphosphate hydrolase protein [Xylaria bambusicola]|uniref:P-loop containing nucleoside triphosphate hydrolase protein n=1 Tax=Xylaria bambusicola TaxID=326684 RepID=UPI002008B5D8|nr:P-loop containing nucleoside triphosphate hydrolase protein [Xylaria bambusicola]KAI0517409.1 P-loop containing nucleoside triphosphate hydrolase protein [Xylaria bambusicola]
MYSRYIPPPRGTSNSLNTEPLAVTPQPSQTPSKPQPTAYARYVPPPKSSQPTSVNTTSSQHVRFDEDDTNRADSPAKRVKLVQDNTAAQTSDQERSKSKKKKRKSIQLSGQSDDTDHAENGAIEASEVQIGEERDEANALNDGETLHTREDVTQKTRESPPPIDTKADESGKRKAKKKKKKIEDASQTLDQTEDYIPHRFQAILNKKTKSIQIATEHQQDDTTIDGAGLVASDESSQQKAPEVELHGLEPIPQPEPVALDTSTPSYETLPPWLASPIRVSMDASAPFTSFGSTPDLGITPEIAERLASKGYKQAFAIQTGVIPLLLPHHCKTRQGDVLVSAATGSGKTLAYTLPVIRDISQGSRYVTRLRALIVVPTRELVRQVHQVCEDCASIFALDGAKRRPRIAMAMGSQSFEHEQASLIEREEVYDPEAYQRRLKRLGRSSASGQDSDHDEDSGYNTEDEERDAIRRREDKIKTLPNYVVAYKSKVDILICTPGRLVEHIKFTPGFCLDFVRWLVVDEADKLLGQNFQQWLDIVVPKLQTQNQMGSRHHKQSNLCRVRKVILSATMTRDLDQLEGLKLHRPKLVVLEGSKTRDDVADDVHQAEHVLPRMLGEAALKVSDPNLKPLFLIDLLRSRHVLHTVNGTEGGISDDDDTSSSGSDSDSDDDLNGSKKSVTPLNNYSKAQNMPTVLIFTKSNETTLRLSRLLVLLAPTFDALIGTLTSTTPYATRRDTLRSFNAGKLRILVASDLVARGIDLPSLDHVINYDMPSSIASYVHRVGRTARAGNAGKAWTLFTNPEARWFWNEIASGKVIERSKPVERVRVTEEKEEAFDDKVTAYEAALEKLGQEAGQPRYNDRKE